MAGFDQQKAAEKIKALNVRLRAASKTALNNAREAGKILQEAKDHDNSLPGGWGKWVQAHCGITVQYANAWVRISKHWEKIAAKVESGEVSTINEALRAIGTKGDKAKKGTTILKRHQKDIDLMAQRLKTSVEELRAALMEMLRIDLRAEDEVVVEGGKK